MSKFFTYTAFRCCCCLIFVFTAGYIKAQNRDTIFTNNFSIDSPDHEIENGKNSSDGVIVIDNSPVAVRKINNEKVEALRKDKAFWYVNEKPFREKPKAESKPVLTKIFGSPWFKALLWCIIVASLIAIIIWFLKASNVKLFSQRKPALNDFHDDFEHENIFAINFDDAIKSAIEAKDFRLAIRLMYLQLLVTLDQRKLISYKQQKTNSDYLFQLSDTSLYRPFFNLTRTFEYSWYGQFTINEARFSEYQKRFLVIQKSDNRLKKYIPHIIISITIIALGLLLLNFINTRPRKMDERISLRQKDKIPYGYYAVGNLLPALFPESDIYSDKNSPGNWDAISFASANQAVILTSVYFNADDDELKYIIDFVQKGNYVFLITKSLSYKASKYLGLHNNNISTEDGLLTESSDSLALSLSLPRFKNDQKYIYPGRRFAGYFSSLDSTNALVLGRNESGQTNFIQLKRGRGALFLHTAPLAFSNYFVLHKKNIAYFEQAFSVIPEKVTAVLWNDYYLTKRSPQKEPNWLSVLFRYKAFKWAMITAIAAILLYTLLGMRRKQRMIPIRPALRNDSLDFVQTIGRLYYDQKDNRDLGKKMFVYFMDHVRNRYKISTDILDLTFINTLHAKSGYPLSVVKGLVESIEYVNESRHITEKELIKFHEQLEMFYQNT